MNVFDKNMIATGALLMALAIAMGAFGAHALKNMVDAQVLNTFEIGIRYQLYHSLAIFMLGIAGPVPQKIRRTVFWFFLVGILLFCGSLYLLSLNAVLSFDASVIGFITPLGGLLFVIGWVWLAYGMLTLKKR